MSDKLKESIFALGLLRSILDLTRIRRQGGLLEGARRCFGTGFAGVLGSDPVRELRVYGLRGRDNRVPVAWLVLHAGDLFISVVDFVLRGDHFIVAVAFESPFSRFYAPTDAS